MFRLCERLKSTSGNQTKIFNSSWTSTSQAPTSKASSVHLSKFIPDINVSRFRTVKCSFRWQLYLIFLGYYVLVEFLVLDWMFKSSCMENLNGSVRMTQFVRLLHHNTLVMRVSHSVCGFGYNFLQYASCHGRDPHMCRTEFDMDDLQVMESLDEGDSTADAQLDTGAARDAKSQVGEDNSETEYANTAVIIRSH